MKRILMHKDDKVLAFTENEHGFVEKVTEVFNAPLLPFTYKTPDQLPFKVQQWLMENRVSILREDINALANFYGREFITPVNYVSLINHYWIRTENDVKHSWATINAYDNWYQDEDILDILVHAPYMVTDSGLTLATNSPNLTMPGERERFWYKEGGKFYILDNHTKKSEFPLMIYGQRLYSKKLMPYANKQYELMPFYLYLEMIDDKEASTDIEKLKLLTEIYNLNPEEINVALLGKTYIIRNSSTLEVIGTYIL